MPYSRGAATEDCKAEKCPRWAGRPDRLGRRSAKWCSREVVKYTRRHLGAGAWHWLNTACCAGASSGRICTETRINKNVSLRGWRQRVAQRRGGRLAEGYDGGEPEEMTIEGTPTRRRPAREGLHQVRAGRNDDRRHSNEASSGSRGSTTGASQRK